MLEFVSFCVTRHLHDGRVGQKVTYFGTYFGKFGYLNRFLFWEKYYFNVFEFLER